MINPFKPMKVREKVLERLKQVQSVIGRHWRQSHFKTGNTVSLGECVEYLLDIRDELIRNGYSIEWHPDKIPIYKITLTMQEGESDGKD